MGVITVVMAAIGLAGPASARAGGGAAAPAGVPGTGPWSAPTPELAGNTPFGPGGLACTSHDFCISIDGFGGTYVFQRGSWRKSPAVMPDTPKSINDTHGIAPDSLDCASPSLCVAGGNDGAVWLWNGISWQADFAPHASGQVVNPACPRDAAVPLCYLDIGNTFARYDGGATWKALGLIEPAPHASTDDSLSCPSASFCEGVEGEGTQAITWQGKSWSQPSAIPGLPSGAINSLSCPSVGQCVLFPTSLNADIHDIWRYVDGQWSQVQTSASGPLAGSQADLPDCLSVSYCLVVAGSGSSSGLAIVHLGPAPDAASVTTDSTAAGTALAVSCGSVCAAGLPGGSFTDAALSGPAITSLSPSAGSTSGITPYQAAGVPLPAPVQVRGHNLELADGVFFGDTPAASWQVKSNDLLLAQPPPGKAGSAVVHIAWANGLTGATAGSAYNYNYLPLYVVVSGEPSVTGQTGQPAHVSITLVIERQPIGQSQLVWHMGDGQVGETAAVGPMPPGVHRLQLYDSSISPTALNEPIQICLDNGRSSVACGYGTAVITSPPLTSQPWWEWLVAGLVIGAAVALPASWLVRRRGRPAGPVTVHEATKVQS
jgi:hypothetical protein